MVLHIQEEQSHRQLNFHRANKVNHNNLQQQTIECLVLFLSPNQWTVLWDTSIFILTMIYHCSMNLQLKGAKEWRGTARFYGPLTMKTDKLAY